MARDIGGKIASAILRWISATEKDQNIDVVHAGEVVLAKIEGKIARTRRQVLGYAEGKFTICHSYRDGDGVEQHKFCDTPAVIVRPDGITYGCITISHEALQEMILLRAQQVQRGNATEELMVQDGYMNKG